MTERDNRDMIVLATKYVILTVALIYDIWNQLYASGFLLISYLFSRYTTPYRSYELGKGKTVNYSGNHKRSLHLSVRDSLKKLQTDYIDVLYLHWWVSSFSSPYCPTKGGVESGLLNKNP